MRVARELACEGVIGRFGVDFVSVRNRTRWETTAVEINLRKGRSPSALLRTRHYPSGVPGYFDPAAERAAYDELCAYTLTHGNVQFIHQHVVDAWAAQHATAESKPIGVTFALAGLYLHVERKLTGRQVQLAHMKMARQKRSWPTFVLPDERGEITAIDVMRAPQGEERDKEIHAWAESVWRAFAMNRPTLVALLAEYGYA